ncbi:hypothetical protein AMECASPLE_029946 [Ameca splendens]|uniref:Uncharacterized protein n=1 Tax=Ameca splendens TaxID=208324 RepID=A0ABV0Z3S3_9TELE
MLDFGLISFQKSRCLFRSSFANITKHVFFFLATIQNKSYLFSLFPIAVLLTVIFNMLAEVRREQHELLVFWIFCALQLVVNLLGLALLERLVAALNAVRSRIFLGVKCLDFIKTVT